ncbi:MAG TPA: hypothetical protein VFB21_05400 [Chthonomonadaceae bacterium]|nr:hypothetical protein [Chthonomonadaceae bacterium]
MIFSLLGLALQAAPGRAAAEGGAMKARLDPLTRYFHITYRVPKEAPAEVGVVCAWSPVGKNEWKAAKVTPLLSELALRYTSDADWKQWQEQGRLVERRAAGLERAVVFNPYPEAQPNGRVDVDFRVQVRTPDGRELSSGQTRLQADNSDVVFIEDWSKVLQQKAVVSGKAAEAGQWEWRTGQSAEAGVTFGSALYGQPGAVPLPQLTYPLDLRGSYALFVCNAPQAGSIRLRLTGDERTDAPNSRRPGEEVLWRWCRMDRQHLVLKPPHTYTGYTPAHIDYVKLVPLSETQVKELDAAFSGKRDKLVAGYWEPYSWAFVENVQEPLQHREPLLAFAEAGVQIVDSQLGRFGMKVVYESRATDQLFYSTIGDPTTDDPNPTTDNVGRMQQYTNTLETELRYAHDLGLNLYANFGASNAYPGTPLQGDISKKHPEWMRGSAMKFELPEVRAYALSLYREALEIGATGLSIDYCRYPDCLDSAETGNLFMRELRHLADEYAKRRGKPVPILVRFPAQGVHLWQFCDYRTWAREGLADTLCPSNLQGRHLHFPIGPYVEAVRGTKCRLLPVVDGLDWGLEMPGLFLWRVRQLYDAGVDGIYVYQADSRVLGRPEDRRTMRLLGSSAAVRRWWEQDTKLRPRCSKGIYLRPPSYPKEGYHGWERMHVWLEGIPMGAVDLILDGKLAAHFDGPPYVFGREDAAADSEIPPGEHTLTVRARDGDGWLEQTFSIRGAK